MTDQRLGGAVCVIGDGDVVRDDCFGTVDGVEPWTPDTLVMCYSVAKPFAALTVLSVVAEGLLELDQCIAEVWPEFAVQGKSATTVHQVLTHQAGLPCFPEAAADLAFDDTDALTDLLAAAAPDHPPGEAVAEHALTYGHLCDALVRRTTGEDLADRWGRIASAHGWDVHLRVPVGDLERVADVVALDGWGDGYLEDPRWGPALGRPPGLLDTEVLNSERFRRCSFPAISAHASARGIARFYADLAAPDGPVAQLVGPQLHRGVITAQATGLDRVIGREVSWTLGMQVDEEDLGMGGAGGCAGWLSLEGGEAVGVVTRGLGDDTLADDVWASLQD